MFTRTRILLIDPGTTREELNEPIGIGALAATLERSRVMTRLRESVSQTGA